MPEPFDDSSEGFPSLAADEVGLWIQFDASPATRTCLPWHEIERVTGYRCEAGGDAVDVWIALDAEHGEFVEVGDHFTGFAQVAAAMPRHLPGLAPAWLESVAALSLEDVLEVWRRPS